MDKDGGSTADGARPEGQGAYARAGVSIKAGDALVERIKPAAARTARTGVVDGLGGFGALFDLQAAGYKDPILVAATDGVGTKLKIAIDTGALDGVGVDLVAMCVNDLLCQGAEPLFFLDYFATGALEPERAAQVIEGVARGCEAAGCALIGGETAEMPGFYPPGAFDLAGFAVGAVERGASLPRPAEPGDALIGVASSGAHSNGYSLIRKLVAEAGLDWGDAAPFATHRALGPALLEPTRIYVRPILAVLRQAGDAVRAMAHITGGGLIENLPRVLPNGLGAELTLEAWERPPVFGWLAAASQAPDRELLQTFNCGVGLVLVVRPAEAERVLERVRAEGETAWAIGRVTPWDGAPPRVALTGRLAP